jgi:citrate lyase subunit beta/citryl-CoA lyase
MSIRPRRSALYMPGSNARALEKARSLPADVLIFDLEDAVAPDQKEVARAQVASAVHKGGYGAREIVVRINSLSGPWGRDDLAAMAVARPDAVLLPKVSTPGDIMRASKELRDAGAPEVLRLWAMMETPGAILNADSIVRTAVDPTSRLAVLVMGTNDLAKDTRARLTRGRASMLTYLSICVAAARAYGVDILDGVFGDLADEEGLRAECEQGRDFGMDGKTLIHPGQIAVANEVFAPAAAEIAWARRVIAAFEAPEAASRGVIALEGRMIERLHEEMARRTIAIAEAVERQQG